jgi:y4mF family transcriptional regulator
MYASAYKDGPVFIRRPSDIGLIVRAARKARSMSQDDLAKLLGVSRLWINEFEGGKPTARLDLVLRALAELDVTLTAHSEAEVSAGTELVETPTNSIDIDDIANTGLASPSSSLSKPRKKRR